MGSLEHPEHLDYVAVSAHKMYAPFGTGALIGRKDTFEDGPPEMCGGGTIKVVTENQVEWAAPPDRDEAGSPNVVGAVAFAKAIKVLEQISMNEVAKHEAELTAYLLSKLSKVPGIKIYGDSNPKTASRRLGVVSFNLDKMPHALVAAILSAEWGIGVRDGCFCAHPYVVRLLGMDEQGTEEFRRGMMADDRRQTPGMVRISFGLYNEKQEIDVLIDALGQITAGTYDGKYKQSKNTGEYAPLDWSPSFDDYFES
jgi:selenocysteine lyase/cysteine desulfurase